MIKDIVARMSSGPWYMSSDGDDIVHSNGIEEYPVATPYGLTAIQAMDNASGIIAGVTLLKFLARSDVAQKIAAALPMFINIEQARLDAAYTIIDFLTTISEEE